jgi:hypothetical protein
MKPVKNGIFYFLIFFQEIGTSVGSTMLATNSILNDCTPSVNRICIWVCFLDSAILLNMNCSSLYFRSLDDLNDTTSAQHFGMATKPVGSARDVYIQVHMGNRDDEFTHKKQLKYVQGISEGGSFSL